MSYELVGRPPGPDAADAVRREFESILEQLERTPTERVSVMFGWAWALKIYEGDWLALDLTGSELRERVTAAEASGLGRIGSDDLHVTLPNAGVERTYCHEADVHVIAAERTNPHLEAQRLAWLGAGWEVHEREVP